MNARELEVLRARARGDVDDAGALLERHLVPRDHAVDDSRLGGCVVEGADVLEADEVLAARDVVVLPVGRGELPVPVAKPVLSVGLDRGGDVRGKRPGRRRPDHERFALAILEREAHVERRMFELLVLAGEELVLGERRAAARAPLGRPVPVVEPAALVDGFQEPPDVLDVRVRERVVVVVPVHPPAEAPVLLGDHLGELGDALAAARGELGEAVLLDVALRVQARAPSRPRPRPTAPGSRSRSGSAGRSPAWPCSAGRRPSACGPTRGGRPSGCSP